MKAGGSFSDRNIERLLRDTHIPVPSDDIRRLDLIVSGLNAGNGLPLFYDSTVLWPLLRYGHPRSGTSNRGGNLLDAATSKNDEDNAPVLAFGLGVLCCLGREVFGRTSEQVVTLLHKLAREHSRSVNRGARIAA